MIPHSAIVPLLAAPTLKAAITDEAEDQADDPEDPGDPKEQGDEAGEHADGAGEHADDPEDQSGDPEAVPGGLLGDGLRLVRVRRRRSGWVVRHDPCSHRGT
jgi:hypothetical protein